MWTLHLWVFAVTGLFILLAFALHKWIGIHRADVRLPFYASLKTKLWAWAKARWDFTVAAVIALAPVVWSAGLDTFVIVANLLANVVPALAGIDLSNLMIPDYVRTGIQIGAVAIPPLRDAIEKLRGK